MFDDMVVSGQIKKTNKPWTVVLSSIVQAFLLGSLVLIPLISYSELPKGFNAMYLAAPLPPPPAPAPPPLRQLEQRPRVIPTRLEAPNHVPTRVVIVNEPEPTMDFGDRGVPGGIGDTGQLSDLLGSSAVAPPPLPKPAARIRVGGKVEAARLTHQTMPEYPAIARTAHVQGTVVLHAVIGKDGSITSLQYVSGPALLMKAAEDAVSTWRYQPLVLNGEPAEVETEISVVFTLSE
jgi:periplasmic protein TonB